MARISLKPTIDEQNRWGEEATRRRCSLEDWLRLIADEASAQGSWRRCIRCGAPLADDATVRRKWCSARCSQAAHRRRRAGLDEGTFEKSQQGRRLARP